jgi:uncharacterized protein YndB with AHSA1/START domain
MTEPIRRDIVVEAGADRAFEVFTAGMTGWWRPEHHIGETPIAEIVIEPRPGGRWFTRHEDGSETDTGVVRAWEPPHRLVVTWQISSQWRFDADLVTTVEVRFVAEGPDRTRVELEHRDLDGFGPDAADMRETFDAPDAWTETLAGFAAALAPAGERQR